jgi:hypothetical protein
MINYYESYESKHAFADDVWYARKELILDKLRLFSSLNINIGLVMFV